MNTKIAYKLVRLRKNGTLGSLFINKKAVLPIGVWMEAKDYPTAGYAHRPGWHLTEKPYAPHLKIDGRIWIKAEIKDYEVIIRPESQGGIWYLAKWMKIILSESLMD